MTNALPRWLVALSVAGPLAVAACTPAEELQRVQVEPEGPFTECRAWEGKDDLVLEQVPIISEDTLEMTVSHPNGCADHDYEICWPYQGFDEDVDDGSIHVYLEVWHGADRTDCEGYEVWQDLEFDLTYLQEEWRASYGEGAGTITIHVMGESVDYSFE